jgi:hypothetical protein
LAAASDKADQIIRRESDQPRAEANRGERSVSDEARELTHADGETTSGLFFREKQPLRAARKDSLMSAGQSAGPGARRQSWLVPLPGVARGASATAR